MMGKENFRYRKASYFETANTEEVCGVASQGTASISREAR